MRDQPCLPSESPGNGDDGMVKPNHSIFRLKETVCTALVSSLTVGLIGAIVRSVPYFQQSGLVYSTRELPAYPLAYQNNRLAPADIQGKVLVGGPVKLLNLLVQIKGESVSDAVVRIPYASEDRFLVGWMSKSGDPSAVYMLGAETEYRFRRLLPGDSIRFYLYLNNVGSDLANRIEVFDGDGHLATRFRYLPVRPDEVVIPFGRAWIILFGGMFVVVLLLAVSCMRRPKTPAISADRRSRPDPGEQRSPASLPGSPEPNLSAEPLDGGGAISSSSSTAGCRDRGLGGR